MFFFLIQIVMTATAVNHGIMEFSKNDTEEDKMLLKYLL